MSSRRIELAECDAWVLYQTLEQHHDFLHDPRNFEDNVAVLRWLQSGAYASLEHAYYDIAAKWFPVDDATGEVQGPSNAESRGSNDEE